MRDCFKYGNLTLEVDDGNVATPAMVYATIRGAEWSSTYDCAITTGCVGLDDEYEMSDDEYQWLDSQEHHEAVEAAFEVARRDHPEYR